MPAHCLAIKKVPPFTMLSPSGSLVYQLNNRLGQCTNSQAELLLVEIISALLKVRAQQPSDQALWVTSLLTTKESRQPILQYCTEFLPPRGRNICDQICDYDQTPPTHTAFWSAARQVPARAWSPVAYPLLKHWRLLWITFNSDGEITGKILATYKLMKLRFQSCSCSYSWWALAPNRL